MADVVSKGFGYVEGRQIKKAKDVEAQQLRRAAIAREAAGTNQAYEQRKQGEKVQSNAIAVMAASGGVVDSDIVADLKSTTDYNVLSELFAGKTESSSLKLQAKMKEFEGKQAKRLGTAKLITSLVVEGGKAMAGGAGTPTPAEGVGGGAVTNTSGSNLNFNRFAGVS
jgi:hypothetical protein